jgi:methylthioribose-1-phosphate isomerase
LNYQFIISKPMVTQLQDMNDINEIVADDAVQAIIWRNGALELLDQRRLPARETYLELRTAHEVAEAIRNMVVRGAPAIGVTAAYGVALSALAHVHARDWRARVEADMEQLAAARPTAVNLAWALARMRRCLAAGEQAPADALLAEAKAIHAEDIAQNRQMAELGSALLHNNARVLTHCNTGALATGGWGTALGVIRTAFAAGKIERVFATETRPWLQGARLTVWELMRAHIPATLIADSAAAQVMARESIDWVIVGADRVAANGDVANKIGTYSLAVLAREHGARMMVVAPTSTLDPAIASGADIPIEERGPAELWAAASSADLPSGLDIYNPVFDITPAELIDAIVTERGVVDRRSHHFYF